MRDKTIQKLGMSLAATGLVLFAVGVGRGDEPRGLGRLFRFGKDAGSTATAGASSKPNPAARPATPRGATTGGAFPTSSAPRPIFGADAPGTPSASLPDVGAGSTRLTPTLYSPASNSTYAASTASSTHTSPSTGTTTPKLRPQPRDSQAATEADPILTRVALGRTDDGKQFGMFLQVYSDGTVIDSEGVHHVGADVMQPLGQALQASELSQLKGHCGGPPTDFIEQVHITIYERYRGKLRANNFSFSGNPAGCDPSVRTLHAAIEALQLKISGPPVTSTASSTPPAGPADTQAPAPPALGLTVEQ